MALGTSPVEKVSPVDGAHVSFLSNASVFLVMYSISYIFSQPAILVDAPFLMSAFLLVLGVLALGTIIVFEVYPPHLG